MVIKFWILLGTFNYSRYPFRKFYQVPLEIHSGRRDPQDRRHGGKPHPEGPPIPISPIFGSQSPLSGAMGPVHTTPTGTPNPAQPTLAVPEPIFFLKFGQRFFLWLGT